MKQRCFKHMKRSLIASLLATLVTFLLLFAQVAQAATSSSWKVVPSPSPGSASNALIWLETISASNVWAVGVSQNTNGPSLTLVEHWNGASWKVVPSPSPGSASSALFGIEAISASNIWAVGRYQNATGPSLTLVEHWNGASWKVVPSPSPGSSANQLNAIEAVSASNIWAVGRYQNTPDTAQTLVEHWNGASWKVVPSPSPGVVNAPQAIEVVTASDIWFVGPYSNASNTSQTLIEHWNGSSWKVVPSPSPGAASNNLQGIKAVSATNIWAVGGFSNTPAPPYNELQTLVLHWNGSSWKVVSSPNLGSSGNQLNAIEANSASDIWAVGGFSNAAPPVGQELQTLVEHWNGASWKVVPSPSPGSGANQLVAIEAVSVGTLWAVGSFSNATGPFQTLTELYS
jgi:hypothetical protein